MRKNFILVLFVLITLKSACAAPLKSADLINNAKKYDGQTVTYSGEVIGEVMKRGDFAWINVNDGDNAIGVWIKAFLVRDIELTGNYNAAGDMIQVIGIFHRACPEHGGDLDIHAKEIKKISPGKIIIHPIDLEKRRTILLLFIILFLIWTLTLFKRK